MAIKPKKPSVVVYRKGDRVEIVTPELFVRCGYPKTVKSESELVESQYSAVIRQALADMELPGDFGSGSYARAYQEVVRAVAYGRLRKYGFGGAERALYTQTEPGLAGELFLVLGKRSVRTGHYFAPRASYDYCNGGYEAEPGGLRNAKTHTILLLESVNTYRQVEIEAVHVRPAEPNASVMHT